ncbi:MAG TPA: hypothetical protein VHE61_10345 [Opitutaceae bacterium]|nr:hypothetical protein [Opitutaceae bacterium]
MNTYSAWRFAMKSLTAAAMAALLSSVAFAAPPLANTLWFSGDPNTGDWGNQGGGGLTYYQGFNVTDAQGWTIDNVFSVGPGWNTPGSAEWQIRSGMSQGNGGSVLFSGTGSVSNSGYLGHDLMSVNVGSVFLNPGTYWLEVAGGAVTTSNGANSIGSTGSTLRNWPQSSQNYIDLSYYGAASEGVTGKVGRVPDSGGFISLLLGLGTVALLRRRRRVIG